MGKIHKALTFTKGEYRLNNFGEDKKRGKKHSTGSWALSNKGSVTSSKKSARAGSKKSSRTGSKKGSVGSKQSTRTRGYRFRTYRLANQKIKKTLILIL